MRKIAGIPVKTLAIYSGLQYLGLLFFFISRAKDFSIRVETLVTSYDYIKYINESDKTWFIFMLVITTVNTIFQCYWWNSSPKVQHPMKNKTKPKSTVKLQKFIQKQ